MVEWRRVAVYCCCRPLPSVSVHPRVGRKVGEELSRFRSATGDGFAICENRQATSKSAAQLDCAGSMLPDLEISEPILNQVRQFSNSVGAVNFVILTSTSLCRVQGCFLHLALRKAVFWKAAETSHASKSPAKHRSFVEKPLNFHGR